MQPLRISLGIQIHAVKQVDMDAPVYVNACCPKDVLTMGRLTRVLFVCCGGRWGDRRVMRDSEEQVNYDICKTAQQDEASYDNEVKKDQDHSREQRKRRDEGDGGQEDKRS